QLMDADVTIDFEAETTPNDVVSVIATEPLTTDEAWDVYRRGEWRLWRQGEVLIRGDVELPER
ncbi:MAG: class II glutamine amidotransferase, partial [Pseudomonadota bacterium]